MSFLFFSFEFIFLFFRQAERVFIEIPQRGKAGFSRCLVRYAADTGFTKATLFGTKEIIKKEMVMADTFSFFALKKTNPSEQQREEQEPRKEG